MSTDDDLHRFAVRVVELQEQERLRSETAVPDEETLLRVARDLGVTDEQLLKMRDDAKAQKTLAQALRQSGALDDAIGALEDVRVFHPHDLEGQRLLADALYLRSRKTKSEADWQRARALCQGVVATAPADAEARALLLAIHNNPPVASAAKGGGIGWAVVAGVGALVLALVVVVLLAL
jgi:tetratricopeptide (TPR) repeat protein